MQSGRSSRENGDGKREGGRKGEKKTNRPICPGSFNGAAWKLGQNSRLTIVAWSGTSCDILNAFHQLIRRGERREETREVETETHR
jgi:hypothetical protein